MSVAFLPLPSLPLRFASGTVSPNATREEQRLEFGEGTVASEIKILETFFVFIKNLNSTFSPKFDSATVAFGGDGEARGGRMAVTQNSPSALRQAQDRQTLKQPLDVSIRPIGQSTRRPRHHARKSR